MDVEPLIRIGLAALLSIPVGLNRELTGKPAGLRTHMLISAAAAGLGYLSVQAATGDASADPTRIASEVVSGVGFLGAGVILSLRGRVHGLTTATAVFVAMAIGLLSGMGELFVATVLTAIAVFALQPLDWLKIKLIGTRQRHETTLSLVLDGPAALSGLNETLEAAEVERRSIDVRALGDTGVMALVTVRARSDDIRDLVAALAELEGIVSAPGTYGTNLE